MPTPVISIHIELEVLGRTLRQGKENKGDLHQEGRIKLFLSADDMTVYIQNSKGSTGEKKEREKSPNS